MIANSDHSSTIRNAYHHSRIGETAEAVSLLTRKGFVSHDLPFLHFSNSDVRSRRISRRAFQRNRSGSSFQRLRTRNCTVIAAVEAKKKDRKRARRISRSERQFKTIFPDTDTQ
jgi:hypothetical protein